MSTYHIPENEVATFAELPIAHQVEIQAMLQVFWPDRCTESRRHNARSDADREEVLPPATCGRCGEVVTYQEFYRHKCKANKPNERAKQ